MTGEEECRKVFGMVGKNKQKKQAERAKKGKKRATSYKDYKEGRRKESKQGKFVECLLSTLLCTCACPRVSPMATTRVQSVHNSSNTRWIALFDS